MGFDYMTDGEYRQQNSIIKNGEARIPICFCIDTSYSMSFLMNPPEDYRIIEINKNSLDGINSVQNVELLPGRKAHRVIDEVKKVLLDMLQKMQQHPEISNSASVCIITFDKYPNKISDGFVDLKEMNPLEIVRQIHYDAEETNAVDGLKMCLDELAIFNEQNSQNAGNDSYKPVLIFMSDGSPTNLVHQYEEIGRNIRGKSERKLLKVISIGIGNNVNRKWLQSLSRDNKVYSMRQETEFNEVFNFIRQQIDHIVMLTPAEDTTIENTSQNTLNTGKERDTTFGELALNNDNQEDLIALFRRFKNAAEEDKPLF